MLKPADDKKELPKNEREINALEREIEREKKFHLACIVCTQGHCPLTVKNSPVTAAQKSSQGLRMKTADEEGPLQ